ncbi:unnamed protein product [Didymodactylos carnosus]|uniref:Uncharacterized protein n=1 Tax=Didymodactylos carnosus TaxID=1234261 RepID=A0A814GY93_9BILA|nr:unnamed protein product [Didymodactylos carnosus]CAF3774021.1 unnamed protein product [Didymodactylos carnosus]
MTSQKSTDNDLDFDISCDEDENGLLIAQQQKKMNDLEHKLINANLTIQILKDTIRKLRANLVHIKEWARKLSITEGQLKYSFEEKEKVTAQNISRHVFRDILREYNNRNYHGDHLKLDKNQIIVAEKKRLAEDGKPKMVDSLITMNNDTIAQQTTQDDHNENKTQDGDNAVNIAPAVGSQ